MSISRFALRFVVCYTVITWLLAGFARLMGVDKTYHLFDLAFFFVASWSFYTYALANKRIAKGLEKVKLIATVCVGYFVPEIIFVILFFVSEGLQPVQRPVRIMFFTFAFAGLAKLLIILMIDSAVNRLVRSSGRLKNPS